MSDISKADQEAINRTIPGGLKEPTDKPDPLVGETRITQDPVERITRVSRESDKESTREDSTEAGPTPSSEGHGSQAVVDLAVGVAVEADEAAPKDQPSSAEAVDQKNVVRPVDVERAELNAASHAEQLGEIEDKVGPDTVGTGIMAAGDREGDHVHNVDKASQAADDAPDNVKRARAFDAVSDLNRVESPHGRVAEEHDPWAGARWAPHGDLNVPAVSYGPEGSGAIYGPANPAARDQIRGLRGDTDADVEREKKVAAKGGVSIARERDQENRAAKRIGNETTSTLDTV